MAVDVSDFILGMILMFMFGFALGAAVVCELCVPRPKDDYEIKNLYRGGEQ